MTALFPEAVERDQLDFNRTPAWCVELLIPHIGQPQTILDAGCGDGAIGVVLRQHFSLASMYGVEINASRANEAQRHYNGIIRESWTGNGITSNYADLIISNPPFGLAALDFLRCALIRVRPGGTVAFLLPTHWDQDIDANCGPGAPKTTDRELYQQRISHEHYARQRVLDSIRLPDGREGYTKLAIVGGGPNPCRPSFRGGADSATDRYSWFMFGEPWAGQPSRRLHAIPPATPNPQLSLL